MRRAVVLVGVLVVAGCASIIDLPTLEAPPAGAGEGGLADGEAGCLTAAGVSNLALTPRGVHTALDATDVYFTRADPPRGSAILRCSKCGCDKPVQLTTLNQPGGIAVDDKYVYFTDDNAQGSLSRVEKANPSNVLRVSAQESPIGVTFDADFVYWTVIGGGPMGVSTAGVYRARKADLGAVTKLASADSLPDNLVPYAIAVDDAYVYYTTAPDLNDDPAQPCNDSFGTVRRVSKTGGLQVSQVVAAKQPCPIGLALGSDTLYWANLGAGKALGGSVVMAKKSGGTITTLTGGLGRPTSLSFHNGRLAWNAPASQRVEGCTVPACADVATLADAQENPSGLSADDSGVYWVALGTVAQNFTDGALRRFSGP